MSSSSKIATFSTSARPHRLCHKPVTLTTLIAFIFLLTPYAFAAPPYFPDPLHACVVVEPPYIIPDRSNATVPFRGIAITYLQELQAALSFDVEYHEWNTSWSKFIDTMENCTLPPQPSLLSGDDETELLNPGARAASVRHPDRQRQRKRQRQRQRQRICPCHMGVGAFTRTNERVGRVKFVWPLGNEALRMVTRKSDLRVEKASSTWILFSTFSPRVWMLIAIGIMLHAFGTVFFHPFFGSNRLNRGIRAFTTSYRDEQHNDQYHHQQQQQQQQRQRNNDDNPYANADDAPEETKSWSERVMTIVRIIPIAVLVSYAHLLQHPFHDPAHRRLSLHRSAWLLLGLTAGFFLLTVFAASLTVLLFENDKPSAFRSLSDVTGCNIDQSRVAMLHGGASQSFWNSYVNNSNTRDRCQWTRPGRTVATVNEGFDVVMNTSNRVDFFFTSQGSIMYHTNKRCNDLVPVGEPFVFSSVAFVLPVSVDQGMHDDLDRETRLLRERDAYPSAMMLAAKESCDRSRDATITFTQLRIFFILYIVFWTLLVSFRAWFLYKRRQLRLA